MSILVPDCMMPDGADPCGGFQILNSALEAARKERDEWQQQAQTSAEAIHRLIKERDEARESAIEHYNAYSEALCALTKCITRVRDIEAPHFCRRRKNTTPKNLKGKKK
jgi:hypothetical protein